MPLTPEDVSNKRFTPVRLREGYDMGEVDQFLDEVEAELDRMVKENDDLRTKLAAAQSGQGDAGAIAMPASKAPEKPAETPADEVVEEPEKPDVPAAVSAPREEIKVVTAAEASSAALRLLELATNNADAVVAEAKDEAVQIVGAARTEAERLASETKTQTDQLEEEARNRAQNLDSETEARRSELLGDMEREKSRLDGEVENLRAFEREYRSRLKSYFSQQLEALDGHGEGGELPDTSDADAPKRLKSVFEDGGIDGADADISVDGATEVPVGSTDALDNAQGDGRSEGQEEGRDEGENTKV
jgi:DivIVA domain-containing protein